MNPASSVTYYRGLQPAQQQSSPKARLACLGHYQLGHRLDCHALSDRGGSLCTGRHRPCEALCGNPPAHVWHGELWGRAACGVGVGFAGCRKEQRRAQLPHPSAGKSLQDKENGYEVCCTKPHDQWLDLGPTPTPPSPLPMQEEENKAPGGFAEGAMEYALASIRFVPSCYSPGCLLWCCAPTVGKVHRGTCFQSCKACEGQSWVSMRVVLVPLLACLSLQVCAGDVLPKHNPTI